MCYESENAILCMKIGVFKYISLHFLFMKKGD